MPAASLEAARLLVAGAGRGARRMLRREQDAEPTPKATAEPELELVCG